MRTCSKKSVCLHVVLILVVTLIGFLPSLYAQGLPTGWTAQDVGTTGVVGSTSYNGTAQTYSITAGGTAVYGSADSLHYCSQTFTGDFQMIARLASVNSAQNATMFAGLMVRSSTATGARQRMAGFRPSDGQIQYLRRDLEGGSTVHFDTGLKTLPYWFKITRVGSSVTIWHSNDGVSWSAPDNFAGSFEGPILVGMAVSARKAGATVGAVFDNVSFGPVQTDYSTSWLGNSLPGGGPTIGNVQHMVTSMHVDPVNGDTFINGEDENQSFSSYDATGKFRWFGAGTHFQHGFAVTADSTHAYQGRQNFGFVRFNRTDGSGGGTLYLTTKLVKGLAENAGNLYIADATDNRIRVWSTANMTETSSFPVARPRSIAVDRITGNLWIVQEADTTNPAKVLLYQPNGTKLATEITDVQVPRGLATNSAGRLYVADSGANQHVRIYNTNGTLYGTLGALGGIYSTYASTKKGEVHPLKFNHPVAVGVDNIGNVTVACNGPKTWWGVIGSGTGMELRKFNSASTLLWEKNCLEYVDCAETDPSSDGTTVYTREAKYVMDYTKTAGKEWTYKAMTLDPFAYPADPRLGSISRQGGTWVRTIGGQKFLIVTDMVSETLCFYRFLPNSEIVAPAVVFNRGASNRPLDAYIWRDANGNGLKDTGETQQGTYVNNIWSLWVDSAGDIWTTTYNGPITRYTMQGLDAQGNPIYNYANTQTFTRPADIFGAANTTGTRLERAYYYPSNNMMLLSGYTLNKPRPGNAQEYGIVGTEILRYDNWGTSPTLTWRIVLPYAPNTGGHSTSAVKSISVAGNYLFAIRSSDARVFVYNLSDGSLVRDLLPGPEVGGHSGLIDIMHGLSAFKRSNGEYVIFAEEDDQSKVIMYRWNPNPIVAPVTVVDFGGNIVPSTANTVLSPTYNSGGGEISRTLTWSKASSAFSGYTGPAFSFGFERTSVSGDPTSTSPQIANYSWGDHLRYIMQPNAASTNARMYVLQIFNVAPSNLGSGSTIAITAASANGNLNGTNGSARMVVRKGGNYYISSVNHSSLLANSTFTTAQLAVTGSETWAPITPTSAVKNGMNFNQSAAVYAPLVLDNVDGVGFLMEMESGSVGTALHEFRLSGFTVVATSGGTPPTGVPPVFTTHPLSNAAYDGESASFAVAASGDPAPTYQWQRNTTGSWVDIPAATSASFSIPSVTSSDAGQYRAVATNSEAAVTSNAASLTITTSTGLTGLNAVAIGAGSVFVSGVLGDATWEQATDAKGVYGDGGAADSIIYDYQDRPGDFQAVIRVRSVSGPATARAGLMLRETNGDGARMVVIASRSDSKYVHLARTTAGVAGTAEAVVQSGGVDISHAFPNKWVMIRRKGDLVTVAVSTDDITYTAAGSYSLSSLASTVQIGVFTSRGPSGSLAVGNFDSFSVESLTPVTLVNFGGDMVPITANTALSPTYNSGGGEISRTLTWSKASSAFSGYTGPAFGFGFERTSVTGDPTSASPQIANYSWGDYLRYIMQPNAASTNARMYVLQIFNVAAANLGSGSTIAITAASANGNLNSTNGSVRMVVRKGGSYYISSVNHSSLLGSSTFTTALLAVTGSETWAPFAPTSAVKNGMNFNQSAAVYAPLLLDNVDGVGFLMEMESGSAGTALRELRLSGFTVNALGN